MQKWLYLCSILFLSACFGHSPEADFYNLKAQTSISPYHTKNFSVAVNRAVIPSYLNKPQIVMLDENGIQLEISEYQRWGESLESLIQRIVAEDLGKILPNAVVKPQSFFSQSYNYYLTLEVDRMDGTWDRQAVLDAWWTITDGQNNILRREKTALKTPLKQGYNNYVQAQSLQFADLSKQIADFLAHR